MTTRYAEGTKVPVDSSRGEITGILTKHGCQRMAWASAPEGDQLQFELGLQQYRFTIIRPTLDEVRKRYIAEGGRWNLVYDEQAKVDQEWRRRWRAHVLLIKAKLEFVAAGDTTLEREFMPNLIVAGGGTLADWLDSSSGRKLIGAGA